MLTPTTRNRILTERNSNQFVAAFFRHAIVFLYFLASMTSGLLWVTFAPIREHSVQYYNVSETLIDLLALVYTGKNCALKHLCVFFFFFIFIFLQRLGIS